MVPDAPDSFFARPDDIAESVFFLARQPRSAWTFELDLRPYGEHW
jgi:NADP-dependent 3-hydroxy acid dehydrogenase YdfG